MQAFLYNMPPPPPHTRMHAPICIVPLFHSSLKLCAFEGVVAIQ